MRAAQGEAGAAPQAGEAGGGRRGARRLPWLVLALWIGVLAVAVPLAGRLGDVQRDSVVDYLPANADSTQVARVQQELPGGESTDLVVVYHRDGGLTAADRAAAGRQTADLARTYRLAGGAAAPRGVPSGDGATVMYPVSSTAPGQDPAAKRDFVDGVRHIAAGGHGLTVKVGGPGALDSDASEVYSALGGPLLYTTVLVVALLLILIYRSPSLWLVPLVAAGAADATVDGGHLPAQPRLRGHRQRPELGGDDDPRLRRRHGLRAAADGPLPRGTAAPRTAVRRDAHGAAQIRPGDRGLGRHGGGRACCACWPRTSTAAAAWVRPRRSAWSARCCR